MQAITNAFRGPVSCVPPPTIIDLIVAGRTELWLHEGQKNEGGISGRVVWRHLMENREILSSCIRVSDLKAIQTRGLGFFRKYLYGKVILGASLQDYYPCLYEKNGGLELKSQWIEYPLRINDRFLRVL